MIQDSSYPCDFLFENGLKLKKNDKLTQFNFLENAPKVAHAADDEASFMGSICGCLLAKVTFN